MQIAIGSWDIGWFWDMTGDPVIGQGCNWVTHGRERD